MKKVKVFELEESPYNPGYYMIAVKHENFFLSKARGSYHIIQARLMNLSYAQYLRMCRDVCGATIKGKNSMYPVAYFKKGEAVDKLISLLNSRANLVLWEREHKDWEQHQDYLKDKEEQKKKLKELSKNVSN